MKTRMSVSHQVIHRFRNRRKSPHSHLRTRRWYSVYGSPKCSVINFSSNGIRRKFIKEKKTTGGIRKKADFVKKKTAIKISSKPRYIGFRVTRNGPCVTNRLGSSPGRSEVPALRKAENPVKPVMRPIRRKNMPIGRPAGMVIAAKGIEAIKQPHTSSRISTRIGGGIGSGGLAYTLEIEVERVLKFKEYRMRQ